MADPIAEALVAIRPDFTNFQPQLQAGVNRAFRNLKVPPATQGQLAGQMFGPGFQTSSRSAVSNALGKPPKVPDTTQRTLAQQLFGSAFRTESGRALQGALVGLGGGQLAAEAAFFGPGGAAIAVAAGGFIAVVNSAAELEQQLDILQETAGATDEQMKQLSRAALDLGADIRLPGITAQDAAAGMAELAKAGLSVDDVLGSIEGTLQLSIAANISAADAARVQAAALNAFSLAGTEAVHVADLLAGASIAAQGDIQDLALALQQASAVAAQANLPLESTVGALTELAKAGLLGSDAGTSLRTFLLRLVPTTKEAAKFQEQLGIQIDKTRSIGEQLPAIIDQYRSSLSALSQTQRQAILQQIFGTDAIRSATIIIRDGSKGLEENTLAADRQGAAADLAAARTKGLLGAIGGLTSTAQTGATAFGDEFVPALTDTVNAINEVASAALGAVGALASLNQAASVEIPFAGIEVGPLDALTEIPKTIFQGGIAGRALITVIRELTDEADRTKASFDGIGNSITEALGDLDRAVREQGEPFRLAAAIGLTEEQLTELRTVIDREGTAAGRGLGNKFIQGMADGITEKEQSAISAARAALEKVRREGEQQVLDAIRNARANLESLATTLSSDVGQIIDAGPLGQQIDEIKKKLDELQETVSRRQLRFDLTQAKRDLRDAKNAIQQVGELTPQQKREQQEFLEPFQEKVKDAKSSLQEFTLEGKIEELQDLQEAAKKAADQGIQRLTQQFEDGKISADEFAKKLRLEVRPELDAIARENLGLVIERSFLRDLDALVAQAKALSGFLQTAGTTPGPTVVRPSATQAQVNQRIAESAASLEEIRKNAKEQSKEELDKLDIQIGLMRQLVKLLGGNPRTGTPVRGERFR